MLQILQNAKQKITQENYIQEYYSQTTEKQRRENLKSNQRKKDMLHIEENDKNDD